MLEADSVYARGPVPGQTVALLTILVADACPAHGVSIGRWDDKATWRLDAKPEATVEQIAVARAIMDAFDPWGGARPGAAASGAPMPLPIAPVEDEDPGEQDLGAEMLAAEEEAAPAPADHGGVMIHYDQVEIARAQLSMATSDHEEILVSALSNRWPDLIQAFTDTNNLAPDLWSEAQSGDRQEFMRLSSIESRIRAHAVALRRSIKDADGDQLRNIGESLTEGWPT